MKVLKELECFYNQEILGKITNVEEPELLLIELAQYSLKNLEAINTLVESKLILQAFSIVRVLAEGTILLSEATIKNIEMFNNYTRKETKNRADSLKDQQRSFQQGIGTFNGEKSKKLNKILNELKGFGAFEKIQLEEIAKKNNIEFIYSIIYKFCSSCIHICPHTLSKLHKELSEQFDNIELLKYPYQEGKNFVVLFTALCTFEIFHLLNNKFNLKLRAKLNKMKDTLTDKIISEEINPNEEILKTLILPEIEY